MWDCVIQMKNQAGKMSSIYFLSLHLDDGKKVSTLNFHQCFFLPFCLWTLRINSANGLEIKSTEGQSSLTVTNVTEEHYGNYTCVAANNLGVTNASLVLFSKYAEQGPLRRTRSVELSHGKFQNHAFIYHFAVQWKLIDHCKSTIKENIKILKKFLK